MKTPKSTSARSQTSVAPGFSRGLTGQSKFSAGFSRHSLGLKPQIYSLSGCPPAKARGNLASLIRSVASNCRKLNPRAEIALLPERRSFLGDFLQTSGSVGAENDQLPNPNRSYTHNLIHFWIDCAMWNAFGVREDRLIVRIDQFPFLLRITVPQHKKYPDIEKPGILAFKIAQ